jgi:hypothetical protein
LAISFEAIPAHSTQEAQTTLFIDFQRVQALKQSSITEGNPYLVHRNNVDGLNRAGIATRSIPIVALQPPLNLSRVLTYRLGKQIQSILMLPMLTKQPHPERNNVHGDRVIATCTPRDAVLISDSSELLLLPGDLSLAMFKHLTLMLDHAELLLLATPSTPVDTPAVLALLLLGQPVVASLLASPLASITDSLDLLEA